MIELLTQALSHVVCVYMYVCVRVYVCVYMRVCVSVG